MASSSVLIFNTLEMSSFEHKIKCIRQTLFSTSNDMVRSVFSNTKKKSV